MSKDEDDEINFTTLSRLYRYDPEKAQKLSDAYFERQARRAEEKRQADAQAARMQIGRTPGRGLTPLMREKLARERLAKKAEARRIDAIRQEYLAELRREQAAEPQDQTED